MVCEETHDPTLLETADAWSKKHRLPWLLLRAVDFQEGWVGPLFLPGETACYRSLDARLKGNMPFYEEHQAFDQRVQAAGGPRASLGALMPVYDLLAAVAVTEAVKFVSQVIVPHLLGRFLTVNVWTWETEIHEVLRVPGIEPLAEGGPTAFPWKES
jgi:ribosomal protein S12 methylthiotransferase accessory factor